MSAPVESSGPTGEPPPTSEAPVSEAQKRVNDIRKDIEGNANATPKWKKQRAKDLKAAEAVHSRKKERRSNLLPMSQKQPQNRFQRNSCGRRPGDDIAKEKWRGFA